MKNQCVPAPFNPKGHNIYFVCSKCKQKLELFENGEKIKEYQDTTRMGVSTKKIKKYKSVCPKCGIINEDYFDM